MLTARTADETMAIAVVLNIVETRRFFKCAGMWILLEILFTVKRVFELILSIKSKNMLNWTKREGKVSDNYNVRKLNIMLNTFFFFFRHQLNNNSATMQEKH